MRITNTCSYYNQSWLDVRCTFRHLKILPESVGHLTGNFISIAVTIHVYQREKQSVKQRLP